MTIINDLPVVQATPDPHTRSDDGRLLDPGQQSTGAHKAAAGVEPSPSPEANRGTVSTVEPPQVTDVLLDPGHEQDGIHAAPAGVEDTMLLIYSDVLDDLERTRIATENRVRSLRQAKGMEGTPEEQRLQGLVEALGKLEHSAELELKRGMRTHPLAPWVKRTLGVGEKQGARLIASIGNPYIRPEMTKPDGTVEPSRPRTVSELWAYSGYHVLEGVAAARRKGSRANWNATTKMRAFLVAEAAIKAGVRKSGDADDTNGYDVLGRTATSPLGAAYLDGRAKYADAIHPAPCARCGPKGKPAEAGSPLSEGHKHARSVRLVAKEVLRQLWEEARDLTPAG